MFTQTITLDEPFTLAYGEVIDSAVVSPENSFLRDCEDYSITVTFPSADYVSQLVRLFAENASPHQGSENVWQVDDYTLQIRSLIKPRGVSQEFNRGDIVHVRARAELKQGNELLIERVLLIGFVNIEETEVNWDEIPEQQYDW